MTCPRFQWEKVCGLDHASVFFRMFLKPPPPFISGNLSNEPVYICIHMCLLVLQISCITCNERDENKSQNMYTGLVWVTKIRIQLVCFSARSGCVSLGLEHVDVGHWSASSRIFTHVSSSFEGFITAFRPVRMSWSADRYRENFWILHLLFLRIINQTEYLEVCIKNAEAPS